MRSHLPPKRSERRPENGATTIVSRDIGAKVSPAFSALMPSTDCK